MSESIIWGISEGSAGMQSQIEGVLEEVGLPFDMKICRRKKPWVQLPIWWNCGALRQLKPGSDPLQAPWPDMVISSGRRSAALAIAVKRASKGKAKLVHLTNPRTCFRKFDLIVPMAHDKVQGKNVVSTFFALHRLTHKKLKAEQEKWQGIFAHDLLAPYVAVMIGGDTHRYSVTTEAVEELIATLNKVLTDNKGVNLLLTTSRRTGSIYTHRLKEVFAENKRVYFHDVTEPGDNPLLGMLGVASWIFVTNDSVNMMSEACFTGKPVYLLPLEGHADTKPSRFGRALVKKGYAREYGNKLEKWDYPPVNERSSIAARIRALLANEN